MTPRRLVLLLLLALAPLVALAAPASAAPSAAAGPAAQLLALVNGERAAAGLPPLEWRDDVADIALSWSQTMATTGLFAHNDDFFSDATRALLGSAIRGENVSTSGSVETSHANLMASPPHRANILSPEFTQVGIGVVTDAAGRVWVTQGFMRPSGAAPAVAAPAPEPEPVPEPAPEVPAPAPTTVPPAPTTLPPTTAPPAAPTTVAPATTAAPTTSSTTTPLVAAATPPGDPAGTSDEPLAQEAIAFGALAAVGLLHARRAASLRRGDAVAVLGGAELVVASP